MKQQNGNIRVTDIATKMNCTKASVNKAIHNLKDNNLIKNVSIFKVYINNLGGEIR